MARRKAPEPRCTDGVARAIVTLEDLTPDAHNANRHTEHGKKLLSRSLETLGAARPVLATADGVIVAGNATVAEAKRRGLKARVVQTRGDELVVVRRIDLASADPRAAHLRVADNRIAEVNLEWDESVLRSERTTAERWMEPMEIDMLTGEGLWEPQSEAQAEAVRAIAEQAEAALAKPHKLTKEEYEQQVVAPRDERRDRAQDRHDAEFMIEVVFPSWDTLREFQRRWGLSGDLYVPGHVFCAALEARIAGKA